MWLSREEEEKQKELEKLIDWELNKQLTWAIVFLTTLIGLLALLGTNLLSHWIDFSEFPLITTNLVKAPFVIIFLLLLVLGVDMSFYRLATTAYSMRNLVEMLPSELQQKELKERRTPLGWFFEQLIKRTDKNCFSLRTEFVWLLIVLGDLLLIWALVSVG